MKKYIILSIISLLIGSLSTLKARIHYIDAYLDSSYNLVPDVYNLKDTDRIFWYSLQDGSIVLDSVVDYSKKDIAYFKDKPVGTYTIIAETKKWVPNRGENLLVNGDFEGIIVNGKRHYYRGFESKLTPPIEDGDTVVADKKFDQYGNLSDATSRGVENSYENTYAVVSNANKFNDAFDSIKPKSGSHYAVFDSKLDSKKDDSYAWKATILPDKIDKDSNYKFSLYHIIPKTLKNSNGNYSLPEPVIEIEHGTEPTKHKIELVAHRIDCILPSTESSWRYHFTETFKLDDYQEGDSVHITITNENTNSEGNDFCLDDIVFQRVSNDTLELVQRDTFIITVSDCNNKIYSKWNDVLIVDNSDNIYTSYQWYKNGEPIPNATEQFYQRDTTQDSGATTYYVEMKTANGVTIKSCEFFTFSQFRKHIDYNNYPKHEIRRQVYHQGVNLTIVKIFYDDGSSIIKKEFKQ